MDNFKKEQPLVQETGVEKPEELEAQQERLRQSVLRGVADDKRAADSVIESKTQRKTLLVEKPYSLLPNS